MTRRAIALGALLLAAPAPESRGEEIVRRVGSVTFRVDASQAVPGGVVVVRIASRARLGGAWALLEGRRAAFYPDRAGLRALVPVAASSEAGPATLGVEIAARGGAQRIAIPITLAAREYPPRYVFLDERLRALVARPGAARDGRRLLAALRTESKTPRPGPLAPPVGTTGGGFGERRTHTGFAEVESLIDALQGERHRGLDYPVPAGTPVRAPAAGTVLLAGPLVLSGQTVVIDHGQGVLSVLQHLSRVDVRVGETVPGGAAVGASGETGLAPAPLLQWRVYLHGVAVDPTVLGPLLG
jgi:murein DD-endopeptidase MepM/ murein hydrolase activator NlpD